MQNCRVMAVSNIKVNNKSLVVVLKCKAILHVNQHDIFVSPFHLGMALAQ